MNQNKRMITFLVLCFATIFLFQMLTQKPQQEEKPTPKTTEEPKKEQDGKPAEKPDPEAGDGETTPPVVVEPAPTPDEGPLIQPVPTTPPELKDISLGNGYINLVLSTKGAALKSLAISKKEGECYEINLIDSERLKKGLSLVLSDDAGLGLGDDIWRCEKSAGSTTIAKFVCDCRDKKIRVTKIYDITPGETNSSKYGIRLSITVENYGADSVPLKLSLTVASHIEYCDEASPNITGHIAFKDSGGTDRIHNGVEGLYGLYKDAKESEGKDKEEIEKEYQREDVKVLWIGNTNKYFVAVLIPGKGVPEKVDALMRPVIFPAKNDKGDPRKNGVETRMAWDASVSASGKETYEFVYLTTSREKDRLAEFEDIKLLDVAEDGGFLSFLAVPIIGILKGINSVVGNYGWAIIILTFLIRLAMFPLSRKQQISTIKMQKLAPLIKQMKNKYKNDRSKQNQEIMKLYSKNGINPMMGCLPLLIQLPIMFGLFTALRVALDLRNAAFLYINDLSVADGVSLGIRLDWQFPFNLMTFYYLNPLPIIMVIVYIINQRMMPSSDDPQARQQRKMMMMLPVIFFFILYNYAAGLALYITFSTVFGIIEQKIAKKMVAAELESEPAKPAGGKKKK